MDVGNYHIALCWVAVSVEWIVSSYWH